MTEKIAVTLRRETLRSLERARRASGRSRSALVNEAVESWLRTRAVPEEDRRYAEAYLRHPERADEIAAVAGAVVSSWEPWE